MYEHNSDDNQLSFDGEINTLKRKFDYISMKLYSSEEMLDENKRKYRSVFQGPEVDYIFVEVSLYNLNYKRSNWEINVIHKITSESRDDFEKEFCHTVKTSRDEPVIKINRGYGSDNKGSFWKKGEYKWSVYIDNAYIASKEFYIEDLGFARSKGTPYIMLEEIRLFDPDLVETNLFGDRSYYKSFHDRETKKVCVEVLTKNLLVDKCPWTGEFIFLFKTELGEQKAEIRKICQYRHRDLRIRFYVSQNDMEFSSGKYYIELLFMENLIAKIPFKIDNEKIYSTVEDHRTFFPDENLYFRRTTNNEKILTVLDELIGLEEVKETVSNQLTYFKYLNLKQKKRLSEKEKVNLNSLFIGNPGTGKTVVAKMLGRIYKDIGLLSSGHVYEVGRPELVAEYIGHTALKVREAIEKARGGVLFIDEAYSLAREKENKRDYGAEVIEVLIKEMSDGPGDIAIIAAGYTEEMNVFLDSNPGLKSRFKHTFYFKDYTPDELMDIAEYHCKKKNLRLSKGAHEHLYKKVIKEWRKRDKTFGNARFVNELIDRAEMNMSLRVMRYKNIEKAPKLFITRLESWDFEAGNESSYNHVVNLPIDEEGLSEALKELNSLRGLVNVKQDVENLSRLIRFYKEEKKDYMSGISLHSVFTGNPGTGKTTVARIMAKIFCSLGILERGHLIECSRESLVSGYTGQTAIKTVKMIEKAIGGVLFIDEAYSLTTSNDNDYGKEVIETLLKKMEDRRGEFIVICAGYSEQMKYFLDSNPGLRSRFDRVIEFPDYSEKELSDIFIDLLKSNNIKCTAEVYLLITVLINKLFESKSENFANAREVRKLVEQVVINHNLRLSEIPKSKRTEEDRTTLNVQDFDNIEIELKEARQPLGFTKS